MSARRAAVMLACALTGCASTLRPGGSPLALSPEQAVMRAAAAPASGVAGQFDLTVQAIGRQNGMTYLNSEKDYRDQRNLTVAMPDALAEDLTRQCGSRLEICLIGRRIAVRGTARRVQIFLVANGRRTDKYYFQTHLLLTSSDRLALGRS